MYPAGAEWAVEPRIKAGQLNLKNLAEPDDRPDVAVSCDGGELNIASRVKKAAAFLEYHAPHAAARPLFSSAAISARI